MNAAFIHSQEIEAFHYPASCPFKTERAARTKAILESMGMPAGDGKTEIAPRPSTMEEMMLFHARPYLDALKRVSGGDFRAEDFACGLGTDDTPVFCGLFEYAALASGGTLRAAELILSGEARVAFNPSGGYHHAKAREAGGFCYINDVVLACKKLASAGKKVFCLDLDAHHGNGTQEAFYADPRVFTVSLHESGETLYPWGGSENEIGEGSGRGFNVNLPFPAGADDDTYSRAFLEIVPPLLGAFAPDVIVLEIGMDILSVDPLAHLKMTNNVFRDILPPVLQAGKPVLAVGGGGYEPEATARGWALAWEILCGTGPKEDPWIGMGGVFLGSSEWSPGLADRHLYVTGEEKLRIQKKVDAMVEAIKTTVFPLHSLF